MTSLKELKKQYFKKIDSADLEILISFVIGKPKEFILTHPEYKLNKSEENKLKKLIKKKLTGEPIAYLVGEKEFYSLNFKINKKVLVPRPETELIVEKTLELIETIYLTNSKKPIIIIDIGTGSGCIIVTLAKFLSYYRSLTFKFYATDISSQALSIAKTNAKLHNVKQKINFFYGNLLQPFTDNPKLFNYFKRLKNLKQSLIIITANLPYLTPKQIKNSPTIQSEPRLALDGGRDGLKYYRHLIKQLKKPPFTDLSWAAFLEIDPSQKKKIKELIKKELTVREIKFYPDLAGYTRVAKIQKFC